jgi:hypothetical protein
LAGSRHGEGGIVQSSGNIHFGVRDAYAALGKPHVRGDAFRRRAGFEK